MSKLYNAISRLDEIAIAQEIYPATPDIPFQQALNKNGSSLLRMLILSAALILFGLVAVGITAWWQDWFDLQQTTNMATPLPPEPPCFSPGFLCRTANQHTGTGGCSNSPTGEIVPPVYQVTICRRQLCKELISRHPDLEHGR